MKRYFTFIIIIVVAYFTLQYAIYYQGFYLRFSQPQIVCQTKVDEGAIFHKNTHGEFEKMIIKGVNVPSSIAGHFASEYAISQDIWLDWFSKIQDMGANTIRIYTIYNDDFYQALYTYNSNKKEPLYVLQGFEVSGDVFTGSGDAYQKGFYQKLKNDAKDAVDIIHGRKIISLTKEKGSGIYDKDISPWVIGYIFEDSWDAATIAYTNHCRKYSTKYNGNYFMTNEDATVFEALLADVMDATVAYESKKYEEQRLIAFGNTGQTDPFVYNLGYAKKKSKHTQIDAEKIIPKDSFKGGYFAAYTLNLHEYDIVSQLSQDDIDRIGAGNLPKDQNGYFNGYIELLSQYHTMPVIITGYGISTARGSDSLWGATTEVQQGKSLVAMYDAIIAAGCQGAFISTWQDDWQQQTWHNVRSTDPTNEHRWHNVQSKNQCYGLMAFESFDRESMTYVDGDIAEWQSDDVVIEIENLKLSYKYDSAFVYFMIESEDLNCEHTFYLPIDITPNSGTSHCNLITSSGAISINTDRATDFVLLLSNQQPSRFLVQERYDLFRASHLKAISGQDPYVDMPSKTSERFVSCRQLSANTNNDFNEEFIYASLDTGLLKEGDTHPEHDQYDSLADYAYGDACVEIRVPWHLLNFYNPADCIIHDDYYSHYGVNPLKIAKFYIGGVTQKDIDNDYNCVKFEAIPLTRWAENTAYHMRLKKSYNIVKKHWGN